MLLESCIYYCCREMSFAGIHHRSHPMTLQSVFADCISIADLFNSIVLVLVPLQADSYQTRAYALRAYALPGWQRQDSQQPILCQWRRATIEDGIHDQEIELAFQPASQPAYQPASQPNYKQSWCICNIYCEMYCLDHLYYYYLKHICGTILGTLYCREPLSE